MKSTPTAAKIIQSPSFLSAMPAAGVYTGRGRGGILEHLMKTNIKPGVPQGRGYAPPGWGRSSAAFVYVFPIGLH